MKKLILSLASLALLAGVITGCKKDDDSEAPVITINGANPYKIAVGGTFNATFDVAANGLGATASDNKDGDLGVVAGDYSELIMNVAGEYEVHYEATDKAGNIGDDHRIMYVTHTGAQLVTSWPTITDGCDAGGTTFIVSSVVSDQYAFTVTGLFDGLASDTKITMEANRLTIAEQVLFTGTTQKISGSGTITRLSSGKLKIHLDYTITDTGIPPVNCSLDVTSS